MFWRKGSKRSGAYDNAKRVISFMSFSKNIHTRIPDVKRERERES